MNLFLKTLASFVIVEQSLASSVVYLSSQEIKIEGKIIVNNINEMYSPNLFFFIITFLVAEFNLQMQQNSD